MYHPFKKIILFFLTLGYLITHTTSLDPRKKCPLQHLDKRGFVLPYLTSTFLTELTTWKIKDWEVFEWGSGYSTLWFATNCKSIVSIEHNKEWHTAVNLALSRSKKKKHAQCSLKEIETKKIIHPILGEIETDAMFGNLGKGTPYVNSIDENTRLYNCILIDGMHRIECTKAAVKHVKKNGIIILNNANQTTIGCNSIEIFKLLEKFPHYSFKEPQHLDWKTDYWIISQ